MSLNDASPDFLAGLEARLPPGTLRPAEPRDLEEPRGRHKGRAAAVALPRTTAEVAEIVRACAAARVGIVPRAGGTGLVAGQVMEAGPLPLLLSVERMSRIRAVLPEDDALIAEAGVTLAGIRAAAEEAGRLFPLSLASEGTCRIGGNLATNAGGVQVLRYGNARDLCLGVEAVLPDGSVLEGLKLLRKDNTGYDLRHLLIGSEGTLGILTAAVLRLLPRPAEVATAWAVVGSPAASVALLGLVRDRLGDSVTAFELIHGTGLDFLADHFPAVRPPLPSAPWQVLVEAGAGPEGRIGEALESALGAALERGLAQDAAIAASLGQARAMWAVRETIPEANRKVGAVCSHDVSVPVSRLPGFITGATAAVAGVEPSLRINCFGHVGDGNLHFNVFPGPGRARGDHDDQRAAVTEAVHDLVHAAGGSVSAEHGIGRLRTADLIRYGDPAKIAAMRAIKAALDPHGILNPGALLRDG